MRTLLYPFSMLYAMVMLVRNACYQTGVFKSKAYSFPVICVGNLRVGGTGKTPMIEYLVQLLKKDRQLGVLSRGYGRKSKGFQLANEDSNAFQIGDEAAQLLSKHPEVIVAVDADRRNGIREMRKSHEDLDMLLLDDAYQHQAVSAGLTILLSTYDNPYFKDAVLPAGRLREPASGAKRADIIVVTKCPKNLDAFERRSIADQIQPKSHQSVLFSCESYDGVKHQSGFASLELKAIKNAIVLTGIANATNMLEYLNSQFDVKQHLNYADHHWYTESDMKEILNSYGREEEGKTIIITTEKDAQRLRWFSQNETFAKLPIYVLPMHIEFIEGDGKIFNQLIHDFTRSYT